jgi:hypothetical protein
LNKIPDDGLEQMMSDSLSTILAQDSESQKSLNELNPNLIHLMQKNFAITCKNYKNHKSSMQFMHEIFEAPQDPPKPSLEEIGKQFLESLDETARVALTQEVKDMYVNLELIS